MAPPQIHPCQVSKQTTPAPSMPGQHTDHPSSIHARSVQRPPQIHQCQVTTQTTPPPSMPGQHTDHPTSIHARSAHRPPQIHQCQVSAETLQIHQCQVSAETPQIHQCQVSTQTTPDPSMPGQHTDHPSSIHSIRVRLPRWQPEKVRPSWQPSRYSSMHWQARVCTS